jgi:hypothetical protein
VAGPPGITVEPSVTRFNVMFCVVLFTIVFSDNTGKPTMLSRIQLAKPERCELRMLGELAGKSIEKATPATPIEIVAVNDPDTMTMLPMRKNCAELARVIELRLDTLAKLGLYAPEQSRPFVCSTRQFTVSALMSNHGLGSGLENSLRSMMSWHQALYGMSRTEAHALN